MEMVDKLLDSLSPPIKLFIGAMLGIQALAFGAWIFMMLRESRKSKEKQS